MLGKILPCHTAAFSSASRFAKTWLSGSLRLRQPRSWAGLACGVGDRHPL
jgi:hypothetical protein